MLVSASSGAALVVIAISPASQVDDERVGRAEAALLRQRVAPAQAGEAREVGVGRADLAAVLDGQRREVRVGCDVGLRFSSCCLTKLARLKGFTIDIQQYRLLPKPLAAFIALLLPPFEIILALTLMSGLFEWAAIAAVVVLLAFIAASASAVWRKLNISCACFGLLYRQPISRTTLSRDGFLSLLAVAVLGWWEVAPNLVDMSESITSVDSMLALGATAASFTGSLYIALLARGFVRPHRRPFARGLDNSIAEGTS